MSQSSGKGILEDAVKVLRVSWHRCRSVWDDQNAERFGQRYIDPVDPAARQASIAMDRLDSVCQEAVRACE